MELSFANRQLRTLVMETGSEEWPTVEAFDDVHGLVADLLAATSLPEVPFGVPDLSLVSVDGFELLASERVAIECRIDHVPVRRTSGGEPAWDQINRLMIVGWKDLKQ